MCFKELRKLEMDLGVPNDIVFVAGFRIYNDVNTYKERHNVDCWKSRMFKDLAAVIEVQSSHRLQ